MAQLLDNLAHACKEAAWGHEAYLGGSSSKSCVKIANGAFHSNSAMSSILAPSMIALHDSTIHYSLKSVGPVVND